MAIGSFINKKRDFIHGEPLLMEKTVLKDRVNFLNLF